MTDNQDAVVQLNVPVSLLTHMLRAYSENLLEYDILKEVKGLLTFMEQIPDNIIANSKLAQIKNNLDDNVRDLELVDSWQEECYKGPASEEFQK